MPPRFSTVIVRFMVFVCLFGAGSFVVGGPAQAGEQAPSAHEPSGMMVHIPVPLAPLVKVYETVHHDLSVRRANAKDWVALGGGTGFLTYRLWPGTQDFSVEGDHLRAQAVLPFGVEYAKRVDGTLTKLAACGVESPTIGAGRLAVTMLTRLGLGRGYQLVPATSVMSVEPKGSCLLQDHAVDATPLMVQVYRSELQQALPAADQKAMQAVSLKPAMTQVWRELQEPLLVDEANALWLIVQPVAVAPAGVQPASPSLTAAYAVASRPTVVRGARPSVPLRVLPELSETPMPDGFHVIFDAAVPLEEANQRLRDAIVGQEWSLGVGMVRIADAKLYPIGDQAGVEVMLRGLLPLTVVLKGTPEYDEGTGQIVFKRFDYTIKERTGVTDFAEVYLHDTLRDLLGQRVTVPIREELNATRRAVEQGLNRRLKCGRLRGTVEQVALKKLAFHPAGLSASFTIDGELHYDVDGTATAQ